MKKVSLSLLVFGSLYLSAQNIGAGKTLQQNRKYWSNNKQYYLVFQNDGNLVLFNSNGNAIGAQGLLTEEVGRNFRMMEI